MSLQNASESTIDNTRRTYGEPTVHSVPAPASTVTNPVANALKHQSGSSSPLSSIGSSSPQKPAYDYISLPHRPRDSSVPSLKKSLTQSVQSSSSSGYQDDHQEFGDYNFKTNRIHKSLTSRGVRMQENAQESTKGKNVSNHASEGTTSSMSVQQDTNSLSASYVDLESPREDDHLVKVNDYSFDGKLASRFSQAATRKPVTIKSETFTVSNNVGAWENKFKSTEVKHVESVEPSVSAKNNGLLRKHELKKKSKEAETPEDGHVGGIISAKSKREETTTSSSDSKNELESTIEMLKDELREAAAVEVALYSIAAEHGGNANKIHAPARRLSRFYIHACKMGSQAKKANAARAAVTGLILVSKACGNDVPRYLSHR